MRQSLGSSVSKESACSAGDPGSIPGLGRSPGEGNGNPLQYYCLENPMSRGVWWATEHENAKELERAQQLNDNKNLCITKEYYLYVSIIDQNIVRERSFYDVYSISS